MTVVATTPKFAHDWLVHELDPDLFRRGGTIASGAGAVTTGTVLGKITASGKYVPIDFAAGDGSENAAAILINYADATSADVETAILIGNAQIVPNQLTWPAGATQVQKDAALAQLAALDIISHQRG